MSKPDPSIPASELFLKLLEMPRPTELMDFPRLGPDGKPIGRVRIQTLTMEDVERARAMAHAKLKAKGFAFEDRQSKIVQEVESDAVAKEVTAMACLTEMGVGEPPVYGRMFRDANDLNKLDPAEVAILFNAYTLVQHKFGPMETLSSEDADAWIKRLGVGGSAFPLLSLSLPDLVELTSLLGGKLFSICQSLASHLSNLPPTLVSALETSITDITSYGELAESSGPSSGEKSEVTLQDAMVLAKYHAEQD